MSCISQYAFHLICDCYYYNHPNVIYHFFSAREDIINRNALFNMIPGTLIKCFLRFHYLAKAIILKCINPQRYVHTFSISCCQNPSKRQSIPCLTTGWHLYKHRISSYFCTVFLWYYLFYISKCIR